MNNVFGQIIYSINCNIDIRFIENGWKKGNGLVGYWSSFDVYPSEPDLSATGEQYMYATKLYPRGSLLTLGCIAEMKSTDNGFEVSNFSIKTITDFGVQFNSQNGSENQNASEIKDVLTTHVGYFENILKKLKGEKNRSKASSWILAKDYESSFTKNAGSVQESIRKNLFYRGNYNTGYNQADFGKKDSVYKDDLLIVNKSDSLLLKVRFNNSLFLDPKKDKDKWIGEGEYTLSIQIADNDGIQYFINTKDDIIKTEDSWYYNAKIVEVPIKLRKEVLSTFPSSKDLFLSFLIQDKKSKDAILEGFVKFQVRYVDELSSSTMNKMEDKKQNIKEVNENLVEYKCKYELDKIDNLSKKRSVFTNKSVVLDVNAEVGHTLLQVCSSNIDGVNGLKFEYCFNKDIAKFEEFAKSHMLFDQVNILFEHDDGINLKTDAISEFLLQDHANSACSYKLFTFENDRRWQILKTNPIKRITMFKDGKELWTQEIEKKYSTSFMNVINCIDNLGITKSK